MGESDLLISTSSPMNIVIMRNSRGKLLVYVAGLGVLCFIVFLLSNTHTSLKELEGVNERCQQQRDSFSAQLQVLYEHKNRLEKSLQQEKTDHKNTKEGSDKITSEWENKFQREKDDRQRMENQISQLKTSFSELEEEKAQLEHSLKEQLKALQAQKDLEIEKLQTHITDLLTEKEKLETSNNAVTYKLEQNTGELSLCHMQMQQSKTELHSCQEQIRLHGINVDQKPGGSVLPSLEPPNQKMALEENNVFPKAPQDNEIIPKVNLPDPTVNTTSSMALKRPHIMPAFPGAEGVLPKPPDAPIKDQDAAAEVIDSNKRLDHVAERDLGMVIGAPNKVQDEPVAQIVDAVNKDQDNHPQVAPPNFENVEERDDHAGERGEEGNPLVMGPDGKQQLDRAVFANLNPPPKRQVYPINQGMQHHDDAAANIQDAMNKSPGEVANMVENNNVLGAPPPPQVGLNGFLHRGADGHHGLNDKNYEEDPGVLKYDDDREDDEPANGIQPFNPKGLNGHPPIQDNDFEDQDNQDALDNAKEEEGVMAAPK